MKEWEKNEKFLKERIKKKKMSRVLFKRTSVFFFSFFFFSSSAFYFSHLLRTGRRCISIPFQFSYRKITYEEAPSLLSFIDFWMISILAILWQELRIDRKNDARPFFLWKKDAKLLKSSLSHGKRSNENEKKRNEKKRKRTDNKSG